MDFGDPNTPNDLRQLCEDFRGRAIQEILRVVHETYTLLMSRGPERLDSIPLGFYTELNQIMRALCQAVDMLEALGDRDVARPRMDLDTFIQRAEQAAGASRPPPMARSRTASTALPQPRPPAAKPSSMSPGQAPQRPLPACRQQLLSLSPLCRRGRGARGPGVIQLSSAWGWVDVLAPEYTASHWSGR
jgi:hypothetical protein